MTDVTTVRARSRALRIGLAVLAAVAGAGCSDGTDAPAAAPASVSAPASAPGTAPASPTPDATGAASAPASPVPSGGPADPLASRSPLAEAPAPGQPTCADGTLSVTDADTVVTPSVREQIYVVRTSGADCQLEGYPEVVAVYADGSRLVVSTEPDGPHLAAPQDGGGTREARPVTLSAATTVSFGLGSSRDGSCTGASRLDVRLPGTTTVHRVPTDLEICDGALSVSPVRRLTDDEH